MGCVSKWLLAIFLCIAATSFVAAQNPRGALRGVVQDSSGGRISGAKVIVTSADSSSERNAETSDRGEFRVDDLLPGAYRVRIESAGFEPVESRVEVQVSSTYD